MVGVCDMGGGGSGGYGVEERMRGRGVRNLWLSQCCSIRQPGDSNTSEKLRKVRSPAHFATNHIFSHSKHTFLSHKTHYEESVWLTCT